MCCCCISLRAVITILIKIRVGVRIFQRLCLPEWVFCFFWTSALPELRPLEGGCLPLWAVGLGVWSPWGAGSPGCWREGSPPVSTAGTRSTFHVFPPAQGRAAWPAFQLSLCLWRLRVSMSHRQGWASSWPGTLWWSLQLKKEKRGGRPASTRSLWFSMKERRSGGG